MEVSDIVKLRILHHSPKNPSSNLDGQLLYMSQDGAIKAIMRIAPRPKGNGIKFPFSAPFDLICC